MNYEFPNQNIPEEKKNNLKFHQDHIYAFLAHSSTAAYKERQDEIVELSYAIVHSGSVRRRQGSNQSRTADPNHGHGFLGKSGA